MKLENKTQDLQQEDHFFIDEIKQIVRSARHKAYAAINFAQVEANWLIGRRIVQEEQSGKERAAYGKYIIRIVSQELTQEFGTGFSVTNVKNFRKFYLLFQELAIGQTVSDQFNVSKGQTLPDLLSWSHYERLIRVEDEQARAFYVKEAAANNWAVRTLDRNISTLYYRRLISSQIKEPIENEMLENTAAFQNDNFEFIKNPAVLEFLNLPVNMTYTEAVLEKALVDNLQKFLLELGKGYAFVARQQLIRTETSDFYIDLVFYNYILKCFVIVELKTQKLSHQDLGQLDMYVRMYDDLKKQPSDNPTIGILLCTETDSTIAKYSVLNQNQQLFASKYMPFLPTEAELIAEIEREKLIIKQQLGI
jgi:predicted nuclease of restriction endonuclease-like (RecB) superfamily